MCRDHAVVVGGGLGGLAAAIALDLTGWRVTVLEQTDEITEVGAGISLWANGIRALDALGLGEEVRAHGALSGSGGLRTARGRRLAAPDDSAEAAVTMLHRATLIDLLRRHVGHGAIRTGARVEQVHRDGTVLHSGGQIAADLVVGADGIHSAVRRSLWPLAPAPRHVGYRAYRFITPPLGIEGGGETWGRGERFGYASLPDGRVYGFLVVRSPEGAPPQTRAELRRRFAGWHDPLPRILDAAPQDLLCHDLYELPRLSTYTSGRVALLGDAAHAMTPDLGQGGGQALEDAVALAHALTTSEGLTGYDRVRRPRSQAIALRSHRMGVAAQHGSRLGVGLRDLLVRLTPESAVRRSLASVVDWTPPPLPRASQRATDPGA